MLLVLAHLTLLLASPALEAGDLAPRWLEVRTLEGRSSSIDLEGQVTVVDFFATWCPRCRESLAGYQPLVERFGDRLRIIVVDVKEPAAVVDRFFRFHALPPGVLLTTDPTGRAMRAFGPAVFPSFFVLDESGKVRHVMRGWGPSSARELGRVVGAILDKSAPPARPTAARRRRGAAKEKPVPPSGTNSADERARRMGVEILR